MKFRLPVSLLILAMVVSLLAAGTGCQGPGGQTPTVPPTPTIAEDPGKWDPFGKYAEPVVVNIGRNYEPANNHPSTHTMEDNLFIDHIEERLNIQVKYAWLADPNSYNDKVNMIITSGDLPDAMLVKSLTQFNQLVEAGVLCDLGEAYEKTMSPYLKGIFTSYGERAFNTARFGEELLAIPDLNPGYHFAILWLRDDWLRRANATAPTTLDELVDLAKKFVDMKLGGAGTVGLATNGWLYGFNNAFPTLDPIFHYFNAFPGKWYRNGDGEYEFGSVTEEAKAALAKITEMYAEGLIDKEFAVRGGADVNALLTSGKCGMFFGPWWVPLWPINDTLRNDPEADWKPYLAPLADGDQYRIYRQNPHVQYIVVRKDFANPEAVMKIFNLEYAGIKKLDPDAGAIYMGLGVNWTTWPLPLQFDYDDMVVRQYEHYQEALDSGSTDHLDDFEKMMFADIAKNFENPRADVTVWANAVSRYDGMKVASDPRVVPLDNVFPAETELMQMKWDNLYKLENETYLKIIMGEEPLDYFDEFVEQWKALGGAEITQEVNDMMD